MRVSVVGAGAMGCVFGAHLAATDAVVMLFDANQAHVESIRTRGLRLSEATGERTVPISATHRIAEVPTADLALVLVDSNATAEVAPLLARLLTDDGVALTLRRRCD
jgi:2-dehydropantoate 2-reductase